MIKENFKIKLKNHLTFYFNFFKPQSSLRTGVRVWGSGAMAWYEPGFKQSFVCRKY